MSPAESLHERYRERLARLADTPAVCAALGLDPAGRWDRTYGRFDPGAVPYATLVLERGGAAEILRVEAFEDGGLVATPFPADPGLPTLPAVVGGEVPLTVVRYRPYRRCTLRTANGAPTRYAKVFPDERGRLVHEDGEALWAAAARGELAFAVARPDWFDAPTATLWQHAVAGVPAVGELLGPGGPAIARRMGAALASLPRSGLRPTAVLDGAAQLGRSSRVAAELARRVPRLAPQLEQLLAALGRAHAEAAGRPLVPIHGSPHPHQWLSAGDVLGLVDFDRISRGDPELDVATFQGEMDFEDAARVPVAEINEAFAAGYEAVAGPLDGGLLAAYRAHKRLAKALRSARALRPDGDARAARHLRRAVAALSGA